MRFFDLIVHNPVKIAVITLLVVLFGVVALTRLPMQLTPEVQTPTLTIETQWPGGSPQEVERIITMEQEEQLKGLEGMVKMTSNSSNSTSRITLEFQLGTNMQEALLKVNSRLQQVRDYPIEALRPVISTSDISNRPIAWFNLTSRLPTETQIEDFLSRYPQRRPQLEQALKAHNKGVSMLRLRNHAKEYPEIAELLPPSSRNVSELRQLAEDQIESRFERVRGVAQSEVFGGLLQEVQVTVDPEKLAARGLTLNRVRDVLLSQNVDTSAGDFWDGKRRWVVRALGQFRDLQQIENQLLTVSNNAPVYVRDVATVQLGFKKPTSVVRRFGESTISINAYRETGANVLEVMEDLKATAARLDEEILKPLGLQLITVYDETQYVHSALNLVQENIFLGGAMTMIVLMAFLHFGVRMVLFSAAILGTALAAAFVSPWYFLISLALILVAGGSFARGSLVVALAIPISIIATFLILQLLGRSLNVVSLAGMAFAVGMLVDNSIVVLENIHRHFEMGKNSYRAASDGAAEVWGAVLSSTVTTVAVFFPIVFVQQEAGQLFRDIALAISSGVLISLVVSVTLIPTIAARLLKSQPVTPSNLLAAGSVAENIRPARPEISRTVPHGIGKLAYSIQWLGQLANRQVIGVNSWFQGGWLRQAGIVVLMTGLSLGLSCYFWPNLEYLPSGNQNMTTGILLPPPSYNLDQVIEISNKFDEAMRPYWDVDPDSPEAARLKFPVVGDFYFVAGRSIFMGIQSYRPEQARGMVDLLRSIGSDVPGGVMIAKQSSLFEGRMSGGRTVEIEFTGPDLSRLVALGGQAMSRINEILPKAQARPVPSLDLAMPEIHINAKLVQAAEMGVDTRELGYAANALVDGAFAGNYYLDGRKVDITLQGAGSFSDSTEKIEALPISTPSGQVIPMSAVADVQWSTGPEQIMRRERSRAISIEVSPPADFPLELATSLIEREIVEPMKANGLLAGGYNIALAGTADKLTAVKETFVGKWTGLNLDSVISVGTSQMVLVLLVTYLLMAGLFESWLYPLVIILTVPLGMVGGVLGLSLLNVYLVSIGELPQQLDVLTMLGFVILIGTVVNNPILIVHQSLVFMREQGDSIKAAVLKSVQTRIRPIFMTTLTTVLGLLPLVLFPGAGSELYRGLGSVVLGGLMVSTVFTLFFVPALFSLTIRFKNGVLGWFENAFRRPSRAAA
jgi:HAE1 family hydrophobic/amphiphilic exporter-1